MRGRLHDLLEGYRFGLGLLIILMVTALPALFGGTVLLVVMDSLNLMVLSFPNLAFCSLVFAPFALNATSGTLFDMLKRDTPRRQERQRRAFRRQVGLD